MIGPGNSGIVKPACRKVAPRSVRFHPQAADEAQRAYDWYHERNPSAAQAFSADLEHAINRVTDAPERWPFYQGPTRRYVFQRLPFSRAATPWLALAASARACGRSRP